MRFIATFLLGMLFIASFSQAPKKNKIEIPAELNRDLTNINFIEGKGILTNTNRIASYDTESEFAFIGTDFSLKWKMILKHKRGAIINTLTSPDLPYAILYYSYGTQLNNLALIKISLENGQTESFEFPRDHAINKFLKEN